MDPKDKSMSDLLREFYRAQGCAQQILRLRQAYEDGEISADAAMERILLEAQRILGEAP